MLRFEKYAVTDKSMPAYEFIKFVNTQPGWKAVLHHNIGALLQKDGKEFLQVSKEGVMHLQGPGLGNAFGINFFRGYGKAFTDPLLELYHDAGLLRGFNPEPNPPDDTWFPGGGWGRRAPIC